jgi:hypothetical protein
VPDVVMVGGHANGLPALPATPTLVRHDGRSVAFYRWPVGRG